MSDLITRNGGQMSSGNFIRLIKCALTDGIISGCTITSSGTGITIAAGYIIAGGALVEISATTLTASTAGEVVLKIDKSEEGTATVSVRAVTTLTQQDISGAGTVYEVQLATFGFTGGAVSGLTRKIGNAVPRRSASNIYVQQSAPSNPSTGDLWFW